jgi:hypothetical protein
MVITEFLQSNSGRYPKPDVAYTRFLWWGVVTPRPNTKLEDDYFLQASCKKFVVKPIEAPRHGLDVRYNTKTSLPFESLSFKLRREAPNSWMLRLQENGRNIFCPMAVGTRIYLWQLQCITNEQTSRWIFSKSFQHNIIKQTEQFVVNRTIDVSKVTK